MTEKEVLEKQEENGQQEYYLILIGSFLHAYGQGAFALARATGYKVIRKQRKMGQLLTAGFPIAKIDDVRRKVAEAGGILEQLSDGKTWLMSGIDGTADEAMVTEQVKVAAVPPIAYQQSQGSATLAKEDLPAYGAERDDTAAGGYYWLAVAVRNYHLSNSTPMEAMMFIGDLQKRLKDGTE